MRRVLVLIGLCLLLGACGEDAGKAFLDSRTPPSLPPRAWAPDGWGWGVVRIPDTPEIRYGVAAPPGRPLGHIVFVTDYGEPAEAYFETARELLAKGWAVWTLEPHGQGGSGRFPGPRDAGRSAGFDRDAAALRLLLTHVMRPAGDTPVVVSAQGSAALPVLIAAEQGAPASGLFLWRPDLSAVADSRTADILTSAGLGLLRAEGSRWARSKARLDRRSGAALAWQVANPDLRMGGRSYSWLRAEHDAVERATAPRALSAVRAAVRVMPGEGAAAATAATLCAAVADCRRLPDPGVAAPHLSDADAGRRAWLEELASFAQSLRPPPGAHEK